MPSSCPHRHARGAACCRGPHAPLTAEGGLDRRLHCRGDLLEGLSAEVRQADRKAQVAAVFAVDRIGRVTATSCITTVATKVFVMLPARNRPLAATGSCRSKRELPLTPFQRFAPSSYKACAPIPPPAVTSPSTACCKSPGTTGRRWRS